MEPDTEWMALKARIAALEEADRRRVMCRATLRILPKARERYRDGDPRSEAPDFAGAAFRTAFLSWAVAHDMLDIDTDSIRAAAEACRAHAAARGKQRSMALGRGRQYGNMATRQSEAAGLAQLYLFEWEEAFDSLTRVVEDHRERGPKKAAGALRMRGEIETDLGALDKIAGRRLWWQASPPWAKEGWSSIKRQVLASGKDRQSDWVDWYQRRLKGEPGVFAAAETEDAGVVARIAALPPSHWDQPPAVAERQLAGAAV